MLQLSQGYCQLYQMIQGYCQLYQLIQGYCQLYQLIKGYVRTASAKDNLHVSAVHIYLFDASMAVIEINNLHI